MSIRRRTALVTTSLIILVLGVIAITAYKLLAGPAEGTVVNGTAAAKAPPAFNDQPVTVDDSQASFSYPAAFSPAATASPVAPLLASYNFNHTEDIYTWHLSVSVNQLHTASLDSDSSYQLRQGQPDHYTVNMQKFGNTDYTVVTDNLAGDTSEVVYMLNGTRSADISISGFDSTGQGDLLKTLTMVITTWRWE